MKRLRWRQRSLTVRVSNEGMAVVVGLSIIGGLEFSWTMAPDDARLLADGIDNAADCADRYAAEAIR